MTGVTGRIFESPPLSPAATAARTAAVPWFLYAVTVASTLVVVGIVWDISWHMTIGRDSFWTPAHMCTYAAGLVVGITCGWVALRTTFAGTPEDRDGAVAFWGFRAPLGAWVCVWGSIAMLTSAPFDDWWHNAYGLDVEIISPPHTLLALGLVAIVIGALVWTLAWQNRRVSREQDSAVTRRLEWLFVYGAGMLLSMAAIYVYEYSYRGYQHHSLFYRAMAMAFPVFLLAIARGSTLRWPATTAALVFMGVRIVLGWILPLFPATPQLAPVYNPVDHMVAMEFPILLVAPALAIDLLTHRLGHTTSRLRDWLHAPLYGAAFVLVLLAVQWPFADFLHSPAARNWFFFADRNFPYSLPLTTRYATYQYFRGGEQTIAAFAPKLLLAIVYATLSARIGMGWGTWMTKVRR